MDTNELLDEKLGYIHNNPVKEMLVKNQEDYFFSSAKNYCGSQGLLNVVLLE